MEEPIFSNLTGKNLAGPSDANTYVYFYHGPSSCPCGGGSGWEFVRNKCSAGYVPVSGTPGITPSNNTIYYFYCEPA